MWPGCLATHEYAPPRFSHFWGQWMKFTSLLQPFHATFIHSGVFVGSLDNGFLRPMNENKNIRFFFFFFFFGVNFSATLWQKIRYDSYKWFLWKKNWQSDHIFRAKKRRRNRHFFRIGSNRSPKQKYSMISELRY